VREDRRKRGRRKGEKDKERKRGFGVRKILNLLGSSLIIFL